jgi:hypothetical protein
VTDDNKVMLEQAQEKILQRLLMLTYGDSEYQEALKNDYWQKMPAEKFSFSVMGLLGIESEFKQEILEMTRPIERLEQTLKILNTR